MWRVWINQHTKNFHPALQFPSDLAFMYFSSLFWFPGLQLYCFSSSTLFLTAVEKSLINPSSTYCPASSGKQDKVSDWVVLFLKSQIFF